MSPPSPHLPSSIGSVVIPAITPRDAERLIDLLGQLQAALWQAHGEAILAAADDPILDNDDHHTPVPDDNSPF
jgi:hypothetical protein